MKLDLKNPLKLIFKNRKIRQIRKRMQNEKMGEGPHSGRGQDEQAN